MRRFKKIFEIFASIGVYIGFAGALMMVFWWDARSFLEVMSEINDNHK